LHEATSKEEAPKGATSKEATSKEGASRRSKPRRRQPRRKKPCTKQLRRRKPRRGQPRRRKDATWKESSALTRAGLTEVPEIDVWLSRFGIKGSPVDIIGFLDLDFRQTAAKGG
jgi:hypothetical protein